MSVSCKEGSHGIQIGMVKKQTPLTLEVFEEILMPQINQKVESLRKEFKHLPTTEQYYKREDKTMRELKKLREEVITVGYHYKNTNKRVDLIDKHLRINTSAAF